MVRADDDALALLVDAIEGTRELVLRPLGPLLAGHPAVQWVSLTVGDEFAPRDLADTAGVVETCDLVVTADTAVGAVPTKPLAGLGWATSI